MMEIDINPLNKISGNLKKGDNNTGLEKSKELLIVEILEYKANAVLSKTIIKKSTGSVSSMSFDSGEGLNESVSPFDTFILVIEGSAEIVIGSNAALLQTGESIIIPAHASNSIKPNGRFKLISTIIKNGYD